MSSPFDEAKYRALLDGLEVTEVNLNGVFENIDFRIDTDFHTKGLKINPSLKYTPIGKILKNAQYGISIEMNEDAEGYRIYRMNEIHNMLCDFQVSKCATIPFTDFQKFKLNDRDVLFNRTNSFEWVGRTGIYHKQENKDFIFASYLVRLVPDESQVLPEYLTAFLNSKFGVWDIKRRARHSVNQTNVNPEEVKAIQIPLLSIDFQKKIKSFFDKAIKKLQESQAFYQQAEALLLEELGLIDWQPSEANTAEASFADSFLSSGRLDAEYYQPKYEELEGKIKKYEGGYGRLKDYLIEINTGDFASEYFQSGDNKVFFIRNTNIKNGQIDEDGNYYVYPENFSKFTREGDILTARVGAIGLFGVVNSKFEGCVYSDNVLNIRLMRGMNPDVYCCYFQTTYNRLLLERITGGSVQPLITQTSIKELIIPFIDFLVQEKIATLIQTSQAVQAESKRLLALAKEAVEVAIEQNEEAAEKLISSQITNNQ